MTATDPLVNTTPEELDAILTRATEAAEAFGTQPPADRARQLTAVADALDAASAELVPLAQEESHLSEGRLTGELKRTTYQLRMFARVLDEGTYLGATIDRADGDFPLGPKPDLRRVNQPLGPTLVFAASNFPFAFSVAGGDTASALAAGCPVVLKAHPGHPRLSVRTGEIVTEALRGAGACDGTFAVVLGFETGTTALRDPRIAAAAFTGSVPAGRALFDIANARPTPIPFFGELGSINPAFATDEAVRARGEELAKGFVTSFSGNAGQLCTKPGLLFLPEDHGLEDTLAAASAAVPGHALLNDRLHEGYCGRRSEITQVPGVRVLTAGTADEQPTPTLVTTDVRTLLNNRETLLDEAFGPLSIVATYRSEQDALLAAEELHGNLTATVHTETSGDGDADAAFSRELVRRLRGRAGRVLVNGWPTGVAVSDGMQHGGPYPATTDSRFTSVGTAAIERFLRPVTYQNTPEALLPTPVRSDNPWGVPQTVR
ncbi:aldehyde dehydrogenase (NADP(+)) [Bounagaea algeriensis]